MQNVRSEAFLFPQESEEEMLGTDMLVIEPLGLLGAISEHALAFMAQRKVDGGRHFFPQSSMRFNLLTDRFH